MITEQDLASCKYVRVCKMYCKELTHYLNQTWEVRKQKEPSQSKMLMVYHSSNGPIPLLSYCCYPGNILTHHAYVSLVTLLMYLLWATTIYTSPRALTFLGRKDMIGTVTWSGLPSQSTALRPGHFQRTSLCHILSLLRNTAARSHDSKPIAFCHGMIVTVELVSMAHCGLVMFIKF